MPVTITNLQSAGPLHVPLASGRTLRLSPGQTSAEIPDVEVDDNDAVERLRNGGLVEVAEVRKSAPAARGGRAARGRKAGDDE
ncbi:hypothetical protein [Paractinoplanes durhamensis]|uniref:Uncharacterized protein n=1 Tax=Paractinoplanes durhamensis TaxID=113563 RepID=A0ABQ3Z773_9ACTN|nr:hypothetical protein [Actinoplanes durhamensis]GIE05677.1 hypothetical protein Adu01nite_70270 [Actinoplanes durhamensis]